MALAKKLTKKPVKKLISTKAIAYSYLYREV